MRHPPFPVTNHSRSNFVTPPADLNSDVADTNGMWFGGFWWRCWDEGFTLQQSTLTQPSLGPPTQYVNVKSVKSNLLNFFWRHKTNRFNLLINLQLELQQIQPLWTSFSTCRRKLHVQTYCSKLDLSCVCYTWHLNSYKSYKLIATLQLHRLGCILWLNTFEHLHNDSQSEKRFKYACNNISFRFNDKQKGTSARHQQ